MSDPPGIELHAFGSGSYISCLCHSISRQAIILRWIHHQLNYIAEETGYQEGGRTDSFLSVSILLEHGFTQRI